MNQNCESTIDKDDVELIGRAVTSTRGRSDGTASDGGGAEGVQGACGGDCSGDVIAGGTSSIPFAIFNFTNSIVGSGLMGIPFALRQCGLVLGLVMVLVVAYIIYCSVVMLIECGIRVGKLDFEELALKVAGKRGYYATLLAMLVYSFGAQLTYMVIIGDTVPIILETVFGLRDFDRNSVIIGVAVFVVLPLCLLKDISSLSYAACISIAAEVSILFIVMVWGPSVTSADSSGLRLVGSALVTGVGSITCTFVCQHNAFLVFRSLQRPTRENWHFVARSALLYAAAVCCAMGLAGYLSFYNMVQGDILNNFRDGDKIVNVGRSLLGLSMMMTYPMECYVSKHCLLSIILGKAGQSSDDSGDGTGVGVGAGGKRSPSTELDTDCERARATSPVKYGNGSIFTSTTLNAVHKGIRSPKHKSPGGKGGSKYNVLPIFTIEDDEEDDDSDGAATSSSSKPPEGTGNNKEVYVRNPQRTSDVVSSAAEDVEEVHLNSLGSTDKRSDGEDTKALDAPRTDHGINYSANWYAYFTEQLFFRPEEYWRVTCTLLLWVVVVSIARVVTDMGVVMIVIGITGASAAGYIMPAIVFICTHRAEFDTWWSNEVTNGVCAARLTPIERCLLLHRCVLTGQKFHFALFSLVFGALLMVCGTTAIVRDYEYGTSY